MKRSAPAMIAAVFALGAGAVSSAGADGPAFDCAEASGQIETLVCDDPGLAALDHKLAAVFGAALRALKGAPDENEAVKSLKAHQRGWIKGRNDCWKADDQRRCADDAYTTRIAELQARYALVPGGNRTAYVCDGTPADEIVATFYPTEPSSVRLERGDSQIIAVQARAGSGVRYVADFGIVFWEHHGEALVEWPEGTTFTCQPR